MKKGLKMTPDPRIKDVNSIYTVLDTDKRPYTGRQGYFADYLYEFTNLDKLTIGQLTGICQNDEKPYQLNGGRCYRYFLPIMAVNTKLRPYTKETDLPFDVGDRVFLKHKNETSIIRTTVTGIHFDGDTIKYICFCDFKLSPFELMNYDYSISRPLWNACGVEE